MSNEDLLPVNGIAPSHLVTICSCLLIKCTVKLMNESCVLLVHRSQVTDGEMPSSN